MSEVLENIKTRRSVRKFRPDPVPKDILDKIIEAGLYAPSGMNRQSQIIVAITNKDVRDRLSSLNAKIMGRDTHVYDGSLTMQNLMLAAHELGVSSCWIHRAKEEFDSEEGKELLRAAGIEGDYEGIGHCILGYADGEYPAAPERKEGRVFYID